MEDLVLCVYHHGPHFKFFASEKLYTIFALQNFSILKFALNILTLVYYLKKNSVIVYLIDNSVVLTNLTMCL
jgi:hypothetical protein